MEIRKGDHIVYATGRKVKVINSPEVNGEPGIQVEDPGAMFAGQVFKTRQEVENLVAAGVWEVEAAV